MPTKKQHYIPRMLLKRFTMFRVPMRKPLIYQYDKEKGIERLVDIYDICRKNNLYEIKDAKGRISDKEVNLIENGFSRLEFTWNKIIDKIEQGKDINQDDRDMLGVLLVLQLVRTPEVMELTSEWLYEKSVDIGKPLTQNEADRYMKLALFVWGDVKPEKNWMLNILLEKILFGRIIVIYHSNSDFILNGSRPVLWLKHLATNDVDKCTWYLPIAKNYCIGLVNKETALYKNIGVKKTRCINIQNFLNDGRFIYGSEPISNLIGYEIDKTILDKLKKAIADTKISLRSSLLMPSYLRLLCSLYSRCDNICGKFTYCRITIHKKAINN